MSPVTSRLIDVHMHVGRLGKVRPELGSMSDWYQRQTVFKVFLLYLRLQPEDLTDAKMHALTLSTIEHSGIDQVVCLALDPVFDDQGRERQDLSHLWVSNDYVLALQRELPSRILLGASVHPYDPNFADRVRAYVDRGAVLIKWLPSAQQINLADARVAQALRFLATARGGKPLPLLLHVGSEYAIPSSNPGTHTYDFLSWTRQDSISNWLRFAKRWLTPDVAGVRRHIDAALDAGAWIIFAHCGLPYFVSGPIGSWFEHNDFGVVRDYLQRSHERRFAGRCFADVSAFCTPFRQRSFGEVARLPPETLLYGSDFPTPAFELSAGIKENIEDLKAILKGQFDRILIPEDNLLDVNHHELRHAFPGHPMFGNFHTEILGNR